MSSIPLHGSMHAWSEVIGEQALAKLIAYSPLGFNAAFILLQDTVMQSIAEKNRYYYSAINACMVTFKENLRHSQKQQHTTAGRNLCFQGRYL